MILFLYWAIGLIPTILVTTLFEPIDDGGDLLITALLAFVWIVYVPIGVLAYFTLPVFNRVIAKLRRSPNDPIFKQWGRWKEK